jgi:plasmid stability protein
VNGGKIEIGSPHWTIVRNGLVRETASDLDMRLACTHAYRMSKMVQIRNVPDALHRKLKVRAAGSGQTLSDYLLAELQRLAARPTRDEMLTRLHSRKRVTLKTPAATVIREERESA